MNDAMLEELRIKHDQELQLYKDMIQYKNSQIKSIYATIEEKQEEQQKKYIDDLNKAQQNCIKKIIESENQYGQLIIQYKNKYDTMYALYKQAKDDLDQVQKQLHLLKKTPIVIEKINELPPSVIEVCKIECKCSNEISKLTESMEKKHEKQIQIMNGHILNLNQEIQNLKLDHNKSQREHRRVIEQYNEQEKTYNFTIAQLQTTVTTLEKKQNENLLTIHNLNSLLAQTQKESDLLKRSLRVWKEKYDKKKCQ